MKKLLVAYILAFLLLASFPHSVLGGTNGFIVPPFRASPESHFAKWEVFTKAVGAPGNLPEMSVGAGQAVITQVETNAILTGSGNIYNMVGASEFLVENATPFDMGTVVLQTRTIGSELDYGSVLLTLTNDSGVHVLPPLRRVELDRGSQPGLGANVASLWQWDLSGKRATSYSIAFRAAGKSLSFDSLTLDTAKEFEALFATTFRVNDTSPAIERWMYPHNAAPCDRPAGSVFGSFGAASGVDTRHAQHLLGWNTGAFAPTNRGAVNYLLTRCRITLTINRGNLFAYDPSLDSLQTYFETNHPGYVPDSDEGRPIELFGAAFRNGYDAASFEQCAPFGGSGTGQRNAYAAGWSTQGMLVDVSNNVGKTNTAYAPFEVLPFAVGQTTNAHPGDLVPAGAQITFDLNLNDPFVLAYLQQGLNSGLLRFMVTSLHETGGQFGAPSYPDFATHFNQAVSTPTRLEIEGLVVSRADLDADEVPDDWELFHLNSLAFNGTADADEDGISNLAESQAGTNPKEPASGLRISSVNRDAYGRVKIQVPHAANRSYIVEFTENFSAWSTLSNSPAFNLEAGMAIWTDERADDGLRFYRVRAQ
nr:hypothetical protein [Nitrosomonas nitrosa]